VLVAVLLALTLIAGMGTLTGTQIAQLANELPQYQAAIEKKIGRVQEVTIGRADTLFANITNAFKRVTPAHKGTCRETGTDAGRSPGAARVSGRARSAFSCPGPVHLKRRVSCW
jgi:predicted PurR-regulated permease PerM